MAKTLLLVESKPISPQLVDEYHQWHEQTHIPEMLTIDGFVGARRCPPSPRTTAQSGRSPAAPLQVGEAG